MKRTVLVFAISSDFLPFLPDFTSRLHFWPKFFLFFAIFAPFSNFCQIFLLRVALQLTSPSLWQYHCPYQFRHGQHFWQPPLLVTGNKRNVTTSLYQNTSKLATFWSDISLHPSIYPSDIAPSIHLLLLYMLQLLLKGKHSSSVFPFFSSI